MRILVIGCGSIGRRHIRLLREMGVEVVGVDQSVEALRAVREMGLYAYDNLGNALRMNDFDGAIVATPNHLHREPAEEALRGGCAALIEKPMCHTLEEAGALDLLRRASPVPLLVGYNMRYHSGPLAVKQHIESGALGTIRHASVWCSSFLPSWRPDSDYRTGYAAKKETGGGVLLDCSHELDLCNWWFGKPKVVMAMIRNTGALDGLETEDVADVLIEYESGTKVNVHLDYLGREYRRGCVLVGDKDTLQMDLEPDGRWRLQIGTKQNRQCWAGDRDDMYRKQLLHFLAVVRGGEVPFVSGIDGLTVLSVVEAAKRSSMAGGMVLL